MRRTRLLIVVPAATAAVLAGMSPAAADDWHHHDITASVDDIDDRARVHDDDEVDVSFKYSCDDGRKDHIRAEVKLEQEQRGPDTRYDGTFKLDCDVDDEWVTVRLREDRNDLDDGTATVTVKLYDDGTRLDSESDDVWVSGADRDGDRRHDDGDRDHHHDGDHHDDHDHHDRR